jgi:hypothetical protein
MQKYLIVYKTNIMLHFPGVRHIGSANKSSIAAAVGRGRRVMGGGDNFKSK